MRVNQILAHIFLIERNINESYYDSYCVEYFQTKT